MIKISQDLREFGKVELEFSNAEELKVFLNETVKVCDHYGCKDLVDYGIHMFKKSTNSMTEKDRKIEAEKRFEQIQSQLRPSARRILNKVKELVIDTNEVLSLCYKIDSILSDCGGIPNKGIFDSVVNLAKALKFDVSYDICNRSWKYKQKVLHMLISKMYEQIYNYESSYDYNQMLSELVYELVKDFEAIKEAKKANR